MSTCLEFSKKYFRNRDVNISQIIAASVAFVERIGLRGNFSPEHKLRLAKEQCTTIVYVLCELGRITEKQRDTFLLEFKNNPQRMEEIIELIIDVSRHPNNFQAEQWLSNQGSCF